MRSINFLSLSCLLVAMSSNAMAQGDTCSSATSISGNVNQSFSTTGFSTTGFNGGGSCGNGASAINQDGFFQWTATVAGDYLVDTFGSNFDTRLSVHSGTGCGATCLGHNDDSSGLQSSVPINGVSIGDTFLIQVGGFGNNSGNAVLNIGVFVDLCSGSFEDNLEPNDYCFLATPMGNGTYTDLFTTKIATDNYSVCIAPGQTFQADIAFSHSTADLDLYLWPSDSVNCGAGSLFGDWLTSSEGNSNSESVSWTNTTTVEVTAILEVDVFVNGSGACNQYDLTIAGADACGAMFIGAPFCDPMDVNSTGQSTQLTGSLSGSATSGLHFEVTNGPPNQFGWVLVGTGPSDPGFQVGEGRFCLAVLGGNMYAFYDVVGTDQNSFGIFDSNGVMQNSGGTSSTGTGFDVPLGLPIGGGTVIVSGDTWYYQAWHREANGSSNFSNAVPVTF